MRKSLKSFFVYLFSFLFAVSTIAGLLSVEGNVAYASESNTAVYYLDEDENTRGYWYTGAKGTEEFAQNRVYGKSGVVLPLHFSVGDGQMYKDYDILNDYSESSLPHYVDYPDYVSEITSEGLDSNDYFTDSQLSISDYMNTTLDHWRLLPVDYEDENHFHSKFNTAVMHTGAPHSSFNSYQTYTVQVTDTNWHQFTVYVGNQYGREVYGEAIILIYDLNGDELMSYTAKGTQGFKYVSFAIRGSFKFVVKAVQGGARVAFAGFFFDEFIEDNNNPIAKSNLSATLVGAKQVDLHWENSENNSNTYIYRRIVGEKNYQLISRVEPGISTYSDVDTKVATEYEYILASNIKRDYSAVDNFHGNTKGVLSAKDYCVPDETVKTTISTAPYKATSIEFEATDYAMIENETLYLEASVKKYDSDLNMMVAYSGILVNFYLDGEECYSMDSDTLINVPNMQTNLGNSITDSKGKALLVFKPEYAGEYTIHAEIEAVPNPDNYLDGYDSAHAEVAINIKTVESAEVPVLFTVTDAVKPGNEVTVTGSFIGLGGYTVVAYAPATGEIDREYSDGVADVKYLHYEDLTLIDDTFNTGLMFTLPETTVAGMYDIWIKNIYGWSKPITLNAPRPLWMNENSAYEGIPIEIVGRNFFGSEYGLSESKDVDTQIKLVRVADVNGVVDNIDYEISTKISQGVRYKAEDCYTNEVVMESNPYKITFITPQVEQYGVFQVYVSTDAGKSYRLMDGEQTLVIYPKRSANFDESIFGAKATHIGNDPLDLKVGWAQNINYATIITVPEQYRSVADDYEGFGLQNYQATTKWIQEQIDYLSKQNGGVVYFPAGYYYHGELNLKTGVVLLGEDYQKTFLKYTVDLNNYYRGGGVFSASAATENYGMARMTLTYGTMSLPQKDNILLLDGSNYFVSEVEFILPQSKNGGERGMNQTLGNHLVLQDWKWFGRVGPINCGGDYVYIRRMDLTMIGPVCHLGWKFCIVENTKLVSNSTEGNGCHGWSGRDTAYLAYNYVGNIGPKPLDNTGEAIFFEPPNGQLSQGNILGATSRTFTISQSEGKTVKSNTAKEFGYFMVAITEGRGAGQVRCFQSTPVADIRGNIWGNTYQLMDWETDWDVVPDASSVFSIFLSMRYNTVYQNTIDDCGKGILIYSQNIDCLVANNVSIDSEGIDVWCAGSSTCVGMNLFVRVENNIIRGVSNKTNKGGIIIQSERGGGTYRGITHFGMVIRGNALYDVYYDGNNPLEYDGVIKDYGASEAPKNHRGIIIYTTTVDQQIPGDVRFIIVENNYIENGQYGVYCDNRVTGVVVKDNEFKNIHADEAITYFGPANFYVNSHLIFKQGDEEFSLFEGRYNLNDELPTPVNSKGFLGWAWTKTVESSEETMKYADGNTGILYAIYGAELTLRYNYSTDTGDKGIYKTIVVLEGETVGSLGRPIRVGYTFDGWYYDESCTQAFDTSVPVGENVVLYAKWISKDAKDENPTNVIPSKDYTGLILGISFGGVALIGCGVAAVVYLKKRKGK